MNYTISKYILAYRPLLTVLSFVGILGFFPIYNSFIDQNQPIVALFSPVAKNNMAKSIKQIQSKGATVAQIVKKDLDERFEHLLTQVQQEFPLTKEAWQGALNELASLKGKDALIVKNPVVKHKKGDTPLIRSTRELLASYNIDPSVVKIEVLNDPENASYAFACQSWVSDTKGDSVKHFLQLNLAQLPKQTPAIQEALLRHEISHLLNYDPLVCGRIEGLLKEHGITANEFWANDAFSNLNKHMEYRADLMAATHNVKTAQALVEGFEEHMARYDDITDSRTHPSCKSRNAALNNLIQYMTAENQLNLA